MNTLFIVLLIIFVTPYIIRLLAPYIMKYFFKKVQKNMEQNMGGGNYNPQNEDHFQEEPKNKQTNNKAKDELGDYVDFEEISEDNKQ